MIRLLSLSLALLANVELLELHAPNGHKVFVNMHEITTLRTPTKFDIDNYFSKVTRCVVVTTTGKFLAIKEQCEYVNKLIQEHNAKQK